MTQKVLKVGASTDVTIPKKWLNEVGLKPGDEVVVQVDPKAKSVLIKLSEEVSSRQQRIAELTLRFIHRYRKDLEALARK